VLLDHIMTSNDLAPLVATAGIAHDIFQASITPEGDPKSRQNRISDHAPCFCDFK
jgi:exonuclease III